MFAASGGSAPLHPVSSTSGKGYRRRHLKSEPLNWTRLLMGKVGERPVPCPVQLAWRSLSNASGARMPTMNLKDQFISQDATPDGARFAAVVIIFVRGRYYPVGSPQWIPEPALYYRLLA